MPTDPSVFLRQARASLEQQMRAPALPLVQAGAALMGGAKRLRFANLDAFGAPGSLIYDGGADAGTKLLYLRDGSNTHGRVDIDFGTGQLIPFGPGCRWEAPFSGFQLKTSNRTGYKARAEFLVIQQPEVNFFEPATLPYNSVMPQPFLSDGMGVIPTAEPAQNVVTGGVVITGWQRILLQLTQGSTPITTGLLIPWLGFANTAGTAINWNEAPRELFAPVANGTNDNLWFILNLAGGINTANNDLYTDIGGEQLPPTFKADVYLWLQYTGGANGPELQQVWGLS